MSPIKDKESPSKQQQPTDGAADPPSTLLSRLQQLASGHSSSSSHAPVPAAASKKASDDRYIIIISDSDDDQDFVQTARRPVARHAAVPTPSSGQRGRRGADPPKRVVAFDSDDDIEFLPERSKIREMDTIENSSPRDTKASQPLGFSTPVLSPVKRGSDVAEPGPSSLLPASRDSQKAGPSPSSALSLEHYVQAAEPSLRSIPPLMKRDAPDRDYGSLQTSPAKRAKPEARPLALPAAPSGWSRFLTIQARVDIQSASPAISAGDRLLVGLHRNSSSVVAVHSWDSQQIGYLDRFAAAAISEHLALGTFEIEAYALQPVITAPLSCAPEITQSKTFYIRICIDLRCRTGSERFWFNCLKASFADTRNITFNGLPATAATQAASARVAAAASGAPGVASQESVQLGWLLKIQEHMRDLLGNFRTSTSAPTPNPPPPLSPATNAFAAGRPIPAAVYGNVLGAGTAPLLGSLDRATGFGAADEEPAWATWDDELYRPPPAQPNDDDDDDDGLGTTGGPVTGEQDEVMRGLAGSNYQGRNALNALYDEDACLDVAKLPPFPDLDSLMQGRLKTPLKYHQSQGLAWMVEKEHPLPPRRKADGLVMLWQARRQKDGSARYAHVVRSGAWQKQLPRLPRGGILSDDMGLGKTLMIIALSLYDPTGQKLVSAEVKKKDKEDKAWLKWREAAAATKAKASVTQAVDDSDTETEDEAGVDSEAIIDPLDPEYTKTTLVVCPLSVIFNWVSQIQEHTRDVKVGVFHSDGIKKMLNTRWNGYDFIVTTYDVVKSEFKPIEQIRRAREMAEARADAIHALETQILQGEDTQLNRGELEKLKTLHQQELAQWAAKRASPLNSRLKAAFDRAKGKGNKGEGKGKAKARSSRARLSDDETNTDFSWSSSDTDDNDEYGRQKKAISSTRSDARGSGKGMRKQTSRADGGGDDIEYDLDELFAYELPKLLKTKYRRLVLDEAHVGRNSKTLLHRAVLELCRSSERTWCVTGTPLINSTKDLQSLCAFLQVEHLEDPKMWTKHIDKAIRSGFSQAGSRLLRTIVICTTLRRTKHMKDLEGKAIIELPQIQMYKHAIELDADTRAYYDQVAEVMRGRVLGLWRAGELESQYSNVLVFLCRLRQICCSRDLVPENLLEEMQELLVPTDENAPPVVELDAKAIRTLQEKLRALITTGSEECPICLEAFKDVRITPCAHVFCLACITAVMERQGKCPLDRTLLPPNTPLVAMPTDEQILELPDDEAEDDEKPRSAKEETSPLILEAGADDARVIDSEAVQSAKIDQLIEILRTTERTSASSSDLPLVKSLVFSNFVTFLDKMADRLTVEGVPFCRFVGSMNRAQRAQVLDRFSRDVYPGQQVNRHSSGNNDGLSTKAVGSSRVATDKKPCTLLEMLDKQISRQKGAEEDELVDEALGPAGVYSRGAQKAGGGTPSRARRQQANAGHEDGCIPMVMLISIQAGAVGLNLTAASQVFLLDPWWQGQIEAQAIDRVHRIGQRRPVKVFQFVCTNTVEERVMEIQAEKEELIRNSFAGIKHHGESIDRIGNKKESTIRDILRIFGITGANGEVVASDSGNTSSIENAVEPQVSGSEEAGSSGSAAAKTTSTVAPARAGNSSFASQPSASAAIASVSCVGASTVKGETVDPLPYAGAAGPSRPAVEARPRITDEEGAGKLDVKSE